MVDRSIDDPGSFVATDVYGAFVLLEEAKRRSVTRFIQISTDEVYGEILGDPATEERAAPAAQSVFCARRGD
jgi:dTDP-glucose 4,6-dehydratase